MKMPQRSILIMLALLISTSLISAQESTPEATADAPANGDTLAVVGSGVVNPLLEELNAASDTPLDLSIETTGTNRGLTQFCAGDAAMTTATRGLTIDEDTACADNDVAYAEILLGHNILTFISNPDDEFLSCVTTDDINTLFAPSATGNVTQWSQLTPEGEQAQTSEDTESGYPDLAITPLVPRGNTLTFVTLDEIVDGVGLRDDATQASVSDIIDTVSSTSGAIGVVPLQAAEDVQPDVFILEAGFADVESGCELPAPGNVEERLYTAATSLLLYVNRDVIDTAMPLLNLITSDISVDIIAENGFSPASADAYETNRDVIAGDESGRAFSETEETFAVPQFLTGEINIGGASAPYPLANSVGSNIATGNQQNLSINVTTEGTVNDVPEFCAGELDMVYIEGNNLTDEQQATCDENGVIPVTLPLGGQSVVLVGNAADDHTACLTTDQVATIWGAASTDEVNNWNAISDTFPDQEMMLFGINAGSVLSDLLLDPASEGVPAPVRIDTEINSDELYRAAAVANVEGSLTYMSWNDYQSVVANGQERIQLVAIDNGTGCVIPDAENISDGSYPLSVQLSLVVSQEALTNPAVQSYVWTLYSDENYDTLFTQNDIIGVTFGDLADIRDQILIEFDNAATAQQAQIEAEATPEATAEATDAADSDE